MIFRYRYIIFFPLFLGWVILAMAYQEDTSNQRFSLEVDSPKYIDTAKLKKIIQKELTKDWTTHRLETLLLSNTWIASLEVFVPKKGELKFKIKEHKPLAQINYATHKKILLPSSKQLPYFSKKIPKNLLQVDNFEKPIETQFLVDFIEEIKALKFLEKTNFKIENRSENFIILFSSKGINKRRVVFSKSVSLKRQVEKFKIFYYAVLNQYPKRYDYINLATKNQIVCR